MRILTRPFVFAILLIVGLTASACSSSSEAPTAPDVARAPAAGGAADGTSGLNAPSGATASDRKLIMTATVEMEGTDPWALGQAVKAVALNVRGDLLELSLSGSGEDRSASVTVRVPADRFDEAVARIGALDARVVSSRTSSRDVTEQFVDLDARLSARKQEERRYLDLLGRAEKVEDILKIEQQLGAVRLQIEQLQGQIDSIRSRVAYSTIAVRIWTLGVAGPAPWDPARSVSDAFATLVALMQLAGDIAIWLVIVGWLPAGVIGLGVLLWRALHRRPVPRGT